MCAAQPIHSLPQYGSRLCRRRGVVSDGYMRACMASYSQAYHRHRGSTARAKSASPRRLRAVRLWRDHEEEALASIVKKHRYVEFRLELVMWLKHRQQRMLKLEDHRIGMHWWRDLDATRT